MDEDLSAFLRILQEEIDLYRELIAHAREKTALLVRGQVDAILESNKIDETISVKLRLLEDELARLRLQVCQNHQIKREEFTLSKLAEDADPSLAEELESQSRVFKNLLDQLQKVNQRNRILVESSLDYSRGLIDFISNATSSYQNTGLLKPLSTMQSTMSSRA